MYEGRFTNRKKGLFSIIAEKTGDSEEKRSMNRLTSVPFTERFRIVVSELGCFLRAEIFFLRIMKVFFHLLHDVFRLVEVLNIQVRRRPGNFVGMTALRTELPPLEAVHVRERAA
jgi:hypothetical protein